MSIALLLLAAFAATQDDGPRNLGKPAPPQDPWVEYSGPSDLPGAGHKILLIAGDEEYRSEEALPMLAAILARRHGFHCTVLFSTNPETGEIDPEESTHIAGMHLVDDADVLVLQLRFREFADADMNKADWMTAFAAVVGVTSGFCQ